MEKEDRKIARITHLVGVMRKFNWRDPRVLDARLLHDKEVLRVPEKFRAEYEPSTGFYLKDKTLVSLSECVKCYVIFFFFFIYLDHERKTLPLTITSLFWVSHGQRQSC